MGARGWNRWIGGARLFAIGFLAISTTFCSDGAAPGADDGADTRTLRVSQVVDGVLASGDTARFVYRSVDARPFVVVLTARTSNQRLSLLDSAGTAIVPQIGATATPSPGAPGPSASTAHIVPPYPATYRVSVTGSGAYSVRVLADAPEVATSRLVVDDTISEALDAVGDVDVFSFAALPRELLIGYVQALGPGGGTARMEMISTYSHVAAATTGDDAELETQATDPFPVASTDTIRVTVRGTYVGPYRLMIRRIDRLPEALAQLAIENDTMAQERLDHVGDVDEFLIKGNPRGLYSVMFQLANSREHESARIEVSPVDGPDPFASVTSYGSDPSLIARSTGRFELDLTGSAKVTVRPVGPTRGAYRLFVYRIDTLPEIAAPILVPSDSAMTEAHDLPDDVDDFALVLPTRDTLRFEVAFDENTMPDPSVERGVSLTLFNDAGERISLVGESWIEVASFGTVAVPLQPGRYRLRVASLGAPLGRSVGRYSVRAYRVRSVPEGGVQSIAIGDTVSGVIDPAGDVDEFRIVASKGDHLDLEMQGLDGSVGLSVELVRARDGVGVAIVESGPSLSDSGVYRVTLEESGTHVVRATSSRAGRVISERGPYRLLVKRISGAPERHAAELMLGDVVQDEGIETPGDVDEFLVNGTPGGEFAVQFSAGNDPVGLDLQLVDPVTKDVLQYMTNSGALVSFGRLVLPASGRMMLRVLERSFPPKFGRSQPYTLLTHAVRRPPETRPVRFAIGDTVSGEAIFPVEDIDEFEFSGVSGQRLQALVATPADPGRGLAFQVFEWGTSRLVGAVQVDRSTEELSPHRGLPFTLPNTGRYLVRVQWPQSQVGAYRFAIVER